MTDTTKFILCIGGVVSSIGKGVTAAAIGRLLKARGKRVLIQKLDPYLNVDPGTMSPYQHGEVFVTADGAETDLDLGHYERFTDTELRRECNVTAGQVYSSVIEKERRGDYLGRTIQVIPHITDEIQRRIMQLRKHDVDVIIVEIGGTVGDIEGLPFLEAVRQLRRSVGQENVLTIHVTFLPFIQATGELKTKPTQHSTRELRGIGIQPQVIVARTDHPVSQEVIEKISLFCDVDPKAVIPLPTTDLLYEVPLVLEYAGLGRYIADYFGFNEEPDLSDWRSLVARMRKTQHATNELNIGVVGKYVELHDAYISVKAALTHAVSQIGCRLNLHWINSGQLEKDPDYRQKLMELDGIIVPGGFGPRGVEGMILAAEVALEEQIPYLGLCLGMQTMCVAFARQRLALEGANSTEFDEATPYPIIDLMPDQTRVTDLGGTMRLGHFPCQLIPGTRAAAAYGEENPILERHRHRFEFNNAFRELFQQGGMVFSGISPNGHLIEIAEGKDHPFMLGTQFHPEFQSRPDAAHPLFLAFVEAARAVRQLMPQETTVSVKLERSSY
ncbi:MAG: CTP synthase [Anaerolineaceae bacterium]|nr:CTP synthase [Anaerolineaceae bacterium]